MTLNVGHIAYLNCVPFFHYLREAGFTGNIVQGVPSQLNAMLAEGKLDLSPSSSFEYGLHWRQYVLLPGLSISSKGPVQSVLLFSPVPPNKLEGRKIALTGESATSVNLLKILLWEFCGIQGARFYVPEAKVEECIDRGLPALLIGDRALKMAKKSLDMCHFYDLGEMWHQFTGLPFVFALWIVRKEAVKSKFREISLFLNMLDQSLNKAMEQKDYLARNVSEKSWLSPSDIFNYWKHMSYKLSEEHLHGLTTYFNLCHKYDLFPDMPGIEFFKNPFR